MYMVGQELLRRGHKVRWAILMQVIVVTHAYEPDRAGVRYLPGGMKVYYVSYGVLVRQDTLPNFFALAPVLRSILLRERIELVHAHQALSSMAHEGLFHAKCLGLKTVFTDHSLFGFADVSSIMTNKLLRFALADVDHVVCVSHTGYVAALTQTRKYGASCRAGPTGRVNDPQCRGCTAPIPCQGAPSHGEGRRLHCGAESPHVSQRHRLAATNHPDAVCA